MFNSKINHFPKPATSNQQPVTGKLGYLIVLEQRYLFRKNTLFNNRLSKNNDLVVPDFHNTS